MFISLPARQTGQLARVMHHSNDFSVIAGASLARSWNGFYEGAGRNCHCALRGRAALWFSLLSKKISDRALLGRRFKCVNEFPEPVGENFGTKFPIMGDSGRSYVMFKKSSPTCP